MRHQNELPAKENTQGRHYMPKLPSRTAQTFDPTGSALCEIAKMAPELRKLGFRNGPVVVKRRTPVSTASPN
jgi:hypothetical protein